MKKVICLLLCLVLLGGCASAPAELSSKDTFCMDTVMSLKVWGRDGDQALAGLEGLLLGLERTWSATDEGSYLSSLNQGGVSEPGSDEERLLQRVEALSLRTGGAFNPRLQALSRVWGFYDQQYRVPSQAEIDAAMQESLWDLGAVLKGYAGQACADYLKQNGRIERAMLVLGGNVQTFGSKPEGKPWQIGIQSPWGGDPICILSVEGTVSVVTSGDYQRYFEADGKRYHHIIDPETGRPAESGLSSVTIVCTDGMMADAFSTALFVMGLEEGSRFWRESDDFEVIFITTDGKIYATEGLNISNCSYEVIRR